MVAVGLIGCPGPTVPADVSQAAAPPSARAWRVELRAPDAGWRVLSGEEAKARHPAALLAMSDGAGCQGVVLVLPTTVSDLDVLARERIADLGLKHPDERRYDRVLYAGLTGVRFRVRGSRDDVPTTVRSTVLRVEDPAGLRVVEVRGESTHPDHGLARRCLDQVGGAFQLWDDPVAEPSGPR